MIALAPRPGSDTTLEWEGFDTETQDGLAVLLATPDRHLVEPSSFADCARFLLERPSGVETCYYVAWNVDYDVCAILKFLPPETLDSLAIRGHARHERYKLNYLPGKEFVLTDDETGRRARIYDGFPFVQLGLAKASEKVLGSVEKTSLPEGWITQILPRLRDPLTRPQVVAYCQTDARTAERIWARIGASFLAAGCDFDKPLSPGYIAGQRFKDRIPKFDPIAQEAFMRSYYGGRVEIHRRGAVGPTVSYDLRSAYPAVQAGLCAPEDYARTDRFSDDASQGSYLVRIRSIREPLVPVRPLGTNTILYPVGSWIEWYTRPHVELLREARVPHEILAAWEVFSSSTLAFPEFPDYYARRKSDPQLSLAYKLLLNSCYGKLAEFRSRTVRVNGRLRSSDLTWRAPEGDIGCYRKIEVPGSLACFPWAAHITGSTQASITRAARLDWPNVVAIATDGITFRAPGPTLANVGPALGQWEGPTPAAESVFVACGFYAHRPAPSDPWKVRSRGAVPKGEFTTWFNSDDTTLRIPGLRGQSLAQVRRSGRHADLAWLKDIVQTKNVNREVKREWSDAFGSAREVLTTDHVSIPWVLHESEKESMSRLRKQNREIPTVNPRRKG